jgi:hypothetical protein
MLADIISRHQRCAIFCVTQIVSNLVANIKKRLPAVTICSSVCYGNCAKIAGHPCPQLVGACACVIRLVITLE